MPSFMKWPSPPTGRKTHRLRKASTGLENTVASTDQRLLEARNCTWRDETGTLMGASGLSYGEAAQVAFAASRPGIDFISEQTAAY